LAIFRKKVFVAGGGALRIGCRSDDSVGRRLRHDSLDSLVLGFVSKAAGIVREE
jgi:hypothetical protein